MLVLLYFCTGFSLATVIASLTFLVSIIWHRSQLALSSETSLNWRGPALQQLSIAWIVLGFSSSTLILLIAMYP